MSFYCMKHRKRTFSYKITHTVVVTNAHNLRLIVQIYKDVMFHPVVSHTPAIILPPLGSLLPSFYFSRRFLKTKNPFLLHLLLDWRRLLLLLLLFLPLCGIEMRRQSFSARFNTVSLKKKKKKSFQRVLLFAVKSGICLPYAVRTHWVG